VRFSRTRLSDVLHLKAFAFVQPAVVGTLGNGVVPKKVNNNFDIHFISIFMDYRVNTPPQKHKTPSSHSKEKGAFQVRSS